MARKIVKKPMTTVEAGRRGGMTTLRRHGREFFSKIGKKGGQRLRKIIERGKKAK